jgi:CRP/FNR family cyclic AMP-dependent transcriptional regulator
LAAAIWRFTGRRGGGIFALMSDPKVDALGRVPLFSRCTRKELEFLASRTDEVQLKPNHTLIKQGRASDSFYVLLEGEATVEVDGKARPLLHAGDFFGEIGMLDRGPATATVVTTTPSRAMVMSHVQFRDAIKSRDSLLSTVLAVAADRLRRDSLDRAKAR